MITQHTHERNGIYEGQYTPDQIILLIAFERITMMCFVVNFENTQQ